MCKAALPFCGVLDCPSARLSNFDYGVSVAEIAEQFEVPSDSVEAILAYAKSHRVAHPV